MGAVSSVFLPSEFRPRRGWLGCLLVLGLGFLAVPASADYRITRDHGGDVEKYKATFVRLRDQGERVIIDGICNSACTLVLGIVPLNRICATPRASLGFHQAYFDKRWTAGVRITSMGGTAELMSIYPRTVKTWISAHGGLTADMKHLLNGVELWTIIDPVRKSSSRRPRPKRQPPVGQGPEGLPRLPWGSNRQDRQQAEAQQGNFKRRKVGDCRGLIGAYDMVAFPSFSREQHLHLLAGSSR